MTVGKEQHSLGAGELARLAGVSTDTLRHYEAKGVIPRPLRRPNGYRVYSPDILSRLQLVRRALAIGFTLDELNQILRVHDGGGAPCRKVRQLAADKLNSIEERLRELHALRNQLRATLKDWDVRLARTPANRRSRLLENLEVSAALQPRGHRHFTTTAQKTNRRRKK